MIQYKEITSAVERKPGYHARAVVLPRLTHAEPDTDEYARWEERNHWMIDYQVPVEDKETAVRLSFELDQVFNEDSSHAKIPELVEKLRKLRVKDYRELLPIDWWIRGAYQLADYCGPSTHQAICKHFDNYSGNILEAMCGHTTYLEESPDRVVTALDFCEASLERYPHPERRRIQCDLNQVTDGVQLPFFSDREFDVISICFGFKYPKHLDQLLVEFLRILKPNGILSFIENPMYGYQELIERNFMTIEAQGLLVAAGFKYTALRFVDTPGRTAHPNDEFIHLEAFK